VNVAPEVKTLDPPKDRLLPGEVKRFRTQFEHPDDTATGVVVTPRSVAGEAEQRAASD
jgi:hypothetical protein